MIVIFVSVGSNFHPGLSQSLQTLRPRCPFTLWNESWCLYESPPCLHFASVSMFSFLSWHLAKCLFLGFHLVFSEPPDHAWSCLSWVYFSPKLCRCEDGRNSVISFSVRGLILSYTFTTWACQGTVYPQKLIACLLHNIFQSMCISKEKVCVFPVINWSNKCLVLLIFLSLRGKINEILLLFLCHIMGLRASEFKKKTHGREG